MNGMVAVAFNGGRPIVMWSVVSPSGKVHQRDHVLLERLKKLRYAGEIIYADDDPCVSIRSVAVGLADQTYSLREIEFCYHRTDYDLKLSLP